MFASAATAGLDWPLREERTFLWCVLASIALHALVLIGLSQRDAPAPPAKALLVLTARLAPVATAPRAQPPTASPKPVAPPPTSPSSVSKTSPVQTMPAPTVAKKAPAEAVTPSPAETAPAAAASAASGAQSASQASPAPQPPIGTPTEASPRSGSDADSGTLEQYRLALIVATRRYKRYPAIAMEKGWQGRVEVRMEIGANGVLAGASIKRSSGYEILDNQALDMLKKGKTTVQIPTSLRGRAFSIDVPVVFNLDNPNS